MPRERALNPAPMQSATRFGCVLLFVYLLLITAWAVSDASAFACLPLDDCQCDEQAEFDEGEGCESPGEEESATCRHLNRIVFGDCFTERTGVYTEGWIQQGFTWNPDAPADRFNGPILQNDRANEYQLNQLFLVLAREADTESDSVSLGFRADMAYGTDSFFFQALGLDDRIVSDSASRFYKLAFPQLYAEVYTPIGPGITFQIGKWYTPVGYETGLATEDFFYSKTFGFNTTPYAHTGIQASFDLTDQWSTSHGLHRGTDTWEDNNNALGYCGSVWWTSLDEQTTLTFAINLGPEQDERADWLDLDGAPGPDAPGESLNRVVYALTLERQISDRLLYVVCHDYFFQDGSTNYGIADAEAYGIAQYLIFDWCDHLSVGARIELFRDDDGFTTEGYRSLSPGGTGLFTDLTLGLQYRPTDCLMIRPEVRWDWQDRDDPTTQPAYNAATSNNQFLFSIDAVLRF